MGGQFYNVTRAEMESLLLPQGFHRMELNDDTVELVYGKIVRKGRHQISMRVYSSLNPNGISRGCGQDAIRVMLFTKLDGKVLMVGKPQNVRRITTWAKNLQKAIDKWDSEWRDCPACGHPMVIRNGRHGEFWGCSTWVVTKCDGKKRTISNQPVTKSIEVVSSQKSSLYDRLMANENQTVIPSKPAEAPKPVAQKRNVAPRSNDPLDRFRIPESKISVHQKKAEDVFRNKNVHLIMPSRAGGGKTTMLKHLASFRVARQSMAYLAFNRKNAKEARKKLPHEVSSMTTHAFCCKMLRDNGVSMPDKPDDGKTYKILKELYPTMGGSERKRILRVSVKLVGLAKNFAIRPGDRQGIDGIIDKYSLDLDNENERKVVVELVDEVLALSVPGAKYGSVYDYNDMIWWPIVLDLKPSFHDVVLLDEVQDFNACQIELVKRMMLRGIRIVAVGDPYQAVYRFRGADSDAFDKVAAALEADKRGSESVLLPTNYRCSKKIIEWVRLNTIVKDIEAAPDAIEGEVDEDFDYNFMIEMLVSEYAEAA